MRLAAFLLALVLWPATGQETSPVPKWIGAHALRLSTPEARHGFADMQSLKKVIGDARIVSLGEATHGTREFFQLKHRMLEFLAAEMGFTIFSIEANMPEAYKLNDYVLKGEGDPAKLLAGMYFWTWNTEEVLDMIRWMREFNQSGKGRVQFTGFDMQTPNVAAQIVADYVAKAEPDYAPKVKSATALALKAPQAAAGPNFGVATGTFPVELAAGKKIRFSGYIKTAGVTEQYAGLWWRADGPSGVVAFDNMRDRGVKGTTDWKEYAIELQIPAETKNINFGAILPGNGSAWFDDLKVEIDGKPYDDPAAFDLGFESPSPKGFYTGGNGYRVGPDKEVFHNGKQSLLLRRVAAPAPSQDAVDPKEAVAAWKDIVAHLESSGDAWAAQNARVVLQCMQMRATQVPRDASMAANVKWILDHSPDAKIVLWAHNGHVMTGPGASMGSTLRTIYGDKMVVFGFAFNQGSFQAISAQNRKLQDFTVPPAPAASLEAMLASARVPLFALDLRAAPKTGPIADWLNAAHPMRTIGALYPEDSPYAYLLPTIAPQRFDALLFVETTTAARKNPGAAVATFDFKPASAPADAAAIVFTDPEFPISLAVPRAWKVGQAFRWGERETTARLTDSNGKDVASLYLKMDDKLAATTEEAYARLLKNPELKAAQRIASGAADYRIRDGSIERITVRGRPAVRCIGEFTSQESGAMVEYLTWVSGKKAAALLFATTPAGALENLKRRLDPIIDTLELP